MKNSQKNWKIKLNIFNWKSLNLKTKPKVHKSFMKSQKKFKTNLLNMLDQWNLIKPLKTKVESMFALLDLLQLENQHSTTFFLDYNFKWVWDLVQNKQMLFILIMEKHFGMHQELIKILDFIQQNTWPFSMT